MNEVKKSALIFEDDEKSLGSDLGNSKKLHARLQSEHRVCSKSVQIGSRRKNDWPDRVRQISKKTFDYREFAVIDSVEATAIA